VTKWYSFYLHMSAIDVSVGQSVASGERIGAVGESGATFQAHLHHEIRVGSPCSLEFAEDNRSSTCNTLNADPHVAPVLTYPLSVLGQSSSLQVGVHRRLGKNRNGVARVSPPDVVPDANRYVVKVFSGKKVKKKHVLDLNLRLGYDARSTAALDTLDKSLPFLQPLTFTTDMDQWRINLVVPARWAKSGLWKTTKVTVSVFNVHGQLAKTVALCTGRRRKR